VQIVTSPTEAWLSENLKACKARLLVSSPYVTGAFAELIGDLPDNIRKILVTRTDLRDFAMGVSDIEAICMLARRGTIVKGLAGLHAKVYVIDATSALVTSANATEAGLRSNWECGIAIKEAEIVNQLARLVLSGFGAPEPPVVWKANELEALRKPIQVIKDSLPRLPRPMFARPEYVAVPLTTPGDRKRLVASFSGWTALTLEGVLQQERDEFTMEEVFGVCEPLALRRYPNNRHVREKLRQQLQRLRDLGLVEFLGGGNYRRMVNDSHRS
jgi:hypothetical protein